MLSTKPLLLLATLIAFVAAQGRIAFTILPNTMQAGKDITLHWGGGNGAPVTITLLQGDTDNLQTVELVTGSASGTSYTWKVPSILPNAENYAFRIQQANSEPNYTGMIVLTGGATGSVTDAVAALASVTGVSRAVGSSIGKVSSQSSASMSSPAMNSTVTPTATAVSNSTVTSPAAVGTAAGSAGTGTAMARNTTMSRPSLSASSSASNSGVEGHATSTSGSSGTSTGTAPSSTNTGNAAGQLASNFALLVCAFAGVAYFG